METITITTSFKVFEDVNELPEKIQALMKQAVEARNNAYAPYSNFQVGAAVLLKGGTIVQGNNQENASYPSGLCAERTAIYAAGANHPGKRIVAIVITAASKNHPVTAPAAPCGACRQALIEYEKKQQKSIPLYFMGESGNIIMANAVADLQPLSFDSALL
ncbi:cytidine deaminase [Gangjinia marincola]|uniref:Cytidine deaminase n=1 Tax=Gangjinia marincola TaxID=578463 RepID=A0ABP3XW88_9FLAO